MEPQRIVNAGGRKFLLTVGAGVVYVILFATGLLSEEAFVSLQMVTVGAFIAGNVVQKFGNK